MGSLADNECIPPISLRRAAFECDVSGFEGPEAGDFSDRKGDLSQARLAGQTGTEPIARRRVGSPTELTFSLVRAFRNAQGRPTCRRTFVVLTF